MGSRSEDWSKMFNLHLKGCNLYIFWFRLFSDSDSKVASMESFTFRSRAVTYI